ncbi:DUF6069 family protein [Nocardiopsis sp. CT-R113]|uniref:DUF6069 family protein n=1 Tax=Nocardiopsis codii TaxID=3065942 RepID=A0ABU7K2K1_9ACTN|nr:DUF6069 family protein [Nocardiopsis sp. CT-R113]MEE2036481.1 DUF6069 family protein [Nocardiopsis sp. CT-R113]
MTEFGSERPVNTTRLWSGGLATAVVAALVIFAGALVFRGVFDVPVLAPEEAGNLGDASTVAYALMAAVAALLATALMHLLLLSAPKAGTFFGWIVGLATAIAAVTPFSQGAEMPSQIATALINLVAGIAIITLLRSVGRASTLSRRSAGVSPTAQNTQAAQTPGATVTPIGETPPRPGDEQEHVVPAHPEEPALKHEGILPDVSQEEYHRTQVRAQDQDAEEEQARVEIIREERARQDP